ncbi:protein translocase SEC61 complex subunit gamma [Candidatus Bathyarchaeota archaeon]|nr:MAG: protein translocase SEC61 complex subunit gamma [Candidatus Bathyarchaeota archaeon]
MTGDSILGARSFLQSTKRLFHVAQKPNWEETALLIKISLLGVVIVGGIGFVIRILFWLVGLYTLPASQGGTTP